MSSAAVYRLLAALDEFTRAFPEDYGDIKARLGEIEKQIQGEVLAQVDDGDSPGKQAARSAADGTDERMNARRALQTGTEDQPKTFGDARKAAEGRFQEAAAEPAAAVPAGPSG